MLAVVTEEVCPFCHKKSELGMIETSKVSICLCNSCHRCWEVFRGKVERLIRFKEIPETENEFALCPICWRTMEPDYDRHLVKCPDPICGYERKLPGINKKQAQIKSEFKKVELEVMNLMVEKEEIPDELKKRFKELQAQYNQFHSNDPNPLR